LEAVWKGDLKTINKLTLDKEIGKQVHVACCASLTGRTSLHLALERGHTKVLIRLLEIAQEQFTPLNFKEKKKDDKTPALNNYELSRLMDKIKVIVTLNVGNCCLAWCLLQP
jgi:hypothetical protein